MQVKFKRYNTAEVEALSIEDGALIFDTEARKIYMDNGTERISFNNEEEKEIILYEDETGSNETITLKDNVSNYKYIEIYYRNNDYVRSYAKAKIEESQDTVVDLTANTIYQGIMLIKSRLVQIGSNTIATYNNATLNIEINNTSGTHTCTTDTSNHIYITKVIGCK